MHQQEKSRHLKGRFLHNQKLRQLLICSRFTSFVTQTMLVIFRVIQNILHLVPVCIKNLIRHF